MADSLRTPLTTDTAAFMEVPEMLEFFQRLGPVMDLDPAELPPRLRGLLEQDEEVDLSPRELVDLLKETNLPEETMREVSALAEEAEQARAWEQKALDLLKHAVELAESVKKSRAQAEAAPSTNEVGLQGETITVLSPSPNRPMRVVLHGNDPSEAVRTP